MNNLMQNRLKNLRENPILQAFTINIFFILR